MKILFAANIPDSRTSGMGRCMHFLADALIRRGHQVDLIFKEDFPSSRFPRRISDMLFPFYLQTALFKKKAEYDIVAIHSLAAFMYVLFRVFFKTLPPCILVSYGSDEMRWALEKEEERLGLRKIRLFSKLFYYPAVIFPVKFATCHADHVMVGARFEKEFLKKKYGLPEAKVTFIPNGVSKDFFIPRDYNRPPRKLLFLGGWEWRKGIRYLAEAFVKVAPKFPELRLSVVGVGGGAEMVLPLFPENLHCRIDVIPKVSAEKMPAVYAEHDIFVFPTLFESMSLVVPEAMASGMPSVTTRVCGLPDIVEDGISGLMVEPRDVDAVAEKIAQLLQDRALRERLGCAASQRAAHFTWDEITHDYLQMCGRIIQLL